MDPFTQRMLEKAQQRSRALGISDASKFTLAECTQDDVAGGRKDFSANAMTKKQNLRRDGERQGPGHDLLPNENIIDTGLSKDSRQDKGKNLKLQLIEKECPQLKAPGDLAETVCRQFSTINNDQIDLDIEINIKSDKKIEVQVQVEEQDVSDDSNYSKNTKNSIEKPPVANLRDTSRNRLQRLGALYSNTDNLSSPIHRTEGKFHAGPAGDTYVDGSPKKIKQRTGKLTALANLINQWEDDIAPNKHLKAIPPPKPDLPSRNILTKPKPGGSMIGKADVSEAKDPKMVSLNNEPNSLIQIHEEDETNCNERTPRQLKWDPNVLNSLEAQGFQRRESSTVKLAYEYLNDKTTYQQTNNSLSTKSVIEKENNATTFKEFADIPKKTSQIRTGKVLERAAEIDKCSYAKTQTQINRVPQKDPTELSLKERMQLFEKNKGEALLPKAAFGMAPSINKVRIETDTKHEEIKGSSSNAFTFSNKSNLQNKIAVLVENTKTKTENRILADIQKQRRDEMEILTNRFSKQKERINHIMKKENEPQSIQITSFLPPPPPPPMPNILVNNLVTTNSKRRSPHNTNDDESKRVRTSSIASLGKNVKRIYPALSDLECGESLSDKENSCSTTTQSKNNRECTAKINCSGESLTAEDENESSMDSEAYDSSTGICDDSLGREIMHVVKKKDREHKEMMDNVKFPYLTHNVNRCDNDSSTNSSDTSMGIDDYIDEALNENVDDDDENSEVGSYDLKVNRNADPNKATTASNSFSFLKTPSMAKQSRKNLETSYEFKSDSNTKNHVSTPETLVEPVKSEFSLDGESREVVTLVHTVSFYRRQQNENSANSTPVHKICREQQVLRFADEQESFNRNRNSPDNRLEMFVEESETKVVDNSREHHQVEEKMKKLLDEVCKQQQIIAQTSQALNLCAATIEFSGSTESVEGERHLLVATHRRQACLDEVQRLRVEKSLRPPGAPKERGLLTIKEITVPLRQEYIRKLAADLISGHHLVCLLKYNEHVLATKTVPTLPGLLAVKFPDVLQLNNVYADFRVTLEVYGMTAQREVLPHEVKYHINLNKKSGVKTPKKRGNDNRLVMPPVQSPAGPNVVRTPALVQYGFAIFSLREIQRTSWSLTQILGVSPLDGIVHMKVNCELSVSIEFRGFLTMFEEISGFGAWHRRWCHLNGGAVNYWKYPDDEKKKAPMGSIDLHTCSSLKVSTAPRDICARLHTILLECERSARESDQESLIVIPNGHTTTIRHLLSADTKEEREEWCAYLNKALTLLRAWGTSN